MWLLDIIPPPASYLLCQHACIRSMHCSCIASMCMWLCVPYSTKVWYWQIIKVLHFMDLTVDGRIHQFIKVYLLFNLFWHSSQICQRFSLSNSALYYVSNKYSNIQYTFVIWNIQIQFWNSNICYRGNTRVYSYSTYKSIILHK